jgi:hypothetical protein
MKILKVGLIMAAIAFMTAGAANADLVTNGDFETGDLSGWTQVGFEFNMYVVNWNPHSGTYNATTGGYTFLEQSIAQVIPTTSGQSYTVGFWLSNADYYPDNRFEARWNGQSMILLENQYGPIEYTYYSYTGVATGAFTTIDFGFRYNPSWWDFDDVSMNPVPLPPTVLLLGSGLLGLGTWRRFRKG